MSEADRERQKQIALDDLHTHIEEFKSLLDDIERQATQYEAARIYRVRVFVRELTESVGQQVRSLFPRRSY